MANVQASLLLCYQATCQYVKGEATIGKIALAKSFATKFVREAAALARESMGGNGILGDKYIMKAFLDIESYYTYEGTFDINLQVTGRELSGNAAFKAR